jgi:hypothetical protein
MNKETYKLTKRLAKIARRDSKVKCARLEREIAKRIVKV